MNKFPLVSVIVITYNSSEFVIETLNSIKDQTYSPIELIISDDGSKDNTIRICDEWVFENKNRFSGSKVITTIKNSGITANCNRGLKAANGEWIKLIAGDDLLLENSILDNIDFVSNNNKQFIVSQTLEFIGSFHNPIRKWISNIPPKFLELTDSKSQFEFFLTGNGYLAGSAFFINKNLLCENGGYDEKYKLVEDRPLLLAVSSHGTFIHCMQTATVAHRRHEKGVTNKNTFPEYLFDVYNAIIFYSRKYRRTIYTYNAYWHYYILKLQLRINNNIIRSFLSKTRITFQPIRLLFFKNIFK